MHTNPKLPSKSLIKAICYPETVTFTPKASDKVGLQAQEDSKRSVHREHRSGLVIHPDSPHLGASLDGVVNCSCRAGVIEVKCPYSCTDKSFLEATNDSKFSLKSVGGDCELKSNHCYYYQVQLQMKLCMLDSATSLCGKMMN